jgi:hypothetical protein
VAETLNVLIQSAAKVELACWRAFACSEAPANCHASAACYRIRKDVSIVAIVEAELKLRQIGQEIGFADVVVSPDDAALPSPSSPIAIKPSAS